MYSWGDSLEDWARPGAYSFDSARRVDRAKDAARARASGPRTFKHSRADMGLVDPKKHLVTQSPTPLVIAVDVTGSMARWPFEIFDRLPLLYNTLSQYRPELEVCFAAIGDAYCDRWPLQATGFAKGFNLETQLKGLYGEGGGGDEPESYGLFAWWLANHVTLQKTARKPFLIVYGDATMHPEVSVDEVNSLLGDEISQPVDSIAAWRKVAATWDVWFLRRAGKAGDRIDKQWSRAISRQKIVHIHDEQRAVDYAMGLIARQWGHFEDFKKNMSARHSDRKVADLAKRLTRLLPDTGRSA